MFKGGVPPFVKLNKDVIQIKNSRSFQPDLLMNTLLTKKNEKNEKNKNDSDNDE